MALQEINIDPRHLVRNAMDGDTAAFADLVAAERMAVLRTARALLRDHHEAEDAAQEAFVDAWRHLAELRDPERFRIPLSLFYLGGLSHREVAEAMETTTKAVKSRLNRARAQLRKKVDHE